MKTLLLRSALLLAMTAPAPWATAAPGSCPGLFFSGGYVRAPAPGTTMAAAYGTIENASATPVTVTGVAAEGFTGVSLHQSTTTGGMSGMSPVTSLVVPAKGSVDLTPGGTHIMLSGSAGQLRPKDSVRLKLECGTGSLPVTLPVEAGR